MAGFPNIVITSLGLDMIAQSHTGSPLIFTKMQLGNGSLTENDVIKAMEGLINERLDVPLHSITPITTGQVKLRFSLAEITTIEEGFFLREIGVFAKVGEDGVEQLYAYTNAGNQTDYLDNSQLPINELFDIEMVVGNATVLNVVVKNEISATLQDLEEHNNDPNAHSGASGKSGFSIGQTTMHLGVVAPAGFLELNGSEIGRLTYPELWNWVQTQEELLIDENQWQDDKLVNGESGFYSMGDGISTFRLPLINSFARAKGDSARNVGEFQKDEFKEHVHAIGSQNGAEGKINGGCVSAVTSSQSQRGSMASSGGEESRPKNITFLYCVKAFDGEVNQGLVDLTELVNDMTKKVNYNDFTQLFEENGWCKLPNGFIMQWGMGGTYTSVVTFPITFPNKCFNVQVSWDKVFTENAYSQWLSAKKSLTGFTWTQSGTERSWLAIGC